VRQLTRSLPKEYTGDEFVMPKVVRWQCDGLTLSGWLYKPPRKRGPLPAILYIHGGPTAQSQNAWLAPVQHLVSQGYVVLAPNYRGSTGYGRTFQEANRFDLGGGDMRDVIAGAEFLIREGYADPKRIAITGGSYGGYLTMTALTKHPNVFAAGSAIVPFLNWFTEYENERADLQYWDRQNFGDPVENADRYREYSPITYMQNILAPVQMIAGAHDPRCPASETVQAAEMLKSLGVPYEVIIYPDEGHGFRKVHNRVDAYRKRAEFLNKHLGVELGQAKRKPVAKRVRGSNRLSSAGH
jgi:dipeptidyl aminopeptidase/acylaminoacyl peptidase